MQKVFDTDNAEDMALLWSILPDEAYSIKKYMGCQTWRKKGKDSGYYLEFLKIDFHGKTEITRPIQEATEADIGKICAFWEDGDTSVVYAELVDVISNTENFCYRYQAGHESNRYEHCRRLTQKEIEELC